MSFVILSLVVQFIVHYQSKQKNSQSELLLIIAPRSGGGGVEGLGDRGKGKRGLRYP